MKSNKRYEDDSRPYMSPKPTLTPEEALRSFQLEKTVEQHSTFVREYMLMRASSSSQLLERRAYWMLYRLFLFVEDFHRFPRYKEQVTMLRDFLASQGEQLLPQIVRVAQQEEDRGQTSKVDIFDLREVVSRIRTLKRSLKGILPEQRRS